MIRAICWATDTQTHASWSYICFLMNVSYEHISSSSFSIWRFFMRHICRFDMSRGQLTLFAFIIFAKRRPPFALFSFFSFHGRAFICLFSVTLRLSLCLGFWLLPFSSYVLPYLFICLFSSFRDDIVFMFLRFRFYFIFSFFSCFSLSLLLLLARLRRLSFTPKPPPFSSRATMFLRFFISEPRARLCRFAARCFIRLIYRYEALMYYRQATVSPSFLFRLSLFRLHFFRDSFILFRALLRRRTPSIIFASRSLMNFISRRGCFEIVPAEDISQPGFASRWYFHFIFRCCHIFERVMPFSERFILFHYASYSRGFIFMFRDWAMPRLLSLHASYWFYASVAKTFSSREEFLFFITARRGSFSRRFLRDILRIFAPSSPPLSFSLAWLSDAGRVFATRFIILYWYACFCFLIFAIFWALWRVFLRCHWDAKAAP